MHRKLLHELHAKTFSISDSHTCRMVSNGTASGIGHPSDLSVPASVLRHRGMSWRRLCLAGESGKYTVQSANSWISDRRERTFSNEHVTPFWFSKDCCRTDCRVYCSQQHSCHCLVHRAADATYIRRHAWSTARVPSRTGTPCDSINWKHDATSTL